MSDSILLPCDGCGQMTSPEHIGRRLQRLEWTTRYRPVHIQTLLLGGAAPHQEHDFLYSPSVDFLGEAGVLPEVANLSLAGKTAGELQSEFQRAGFFLAHVLECALESEVQDGAELLSLLEQRLPGVAARIRRSLKPKRVVLISRALQPVVDKIAAMQLGCQLILDKGKPFALDGPDKRKAAARMRESIAAATG
jgi:hypothetical protein